MTSQREVVMFSAHFQKFDEMPYKTLLLVAAGLVLLCQLAALAFVADSQVEKAKLRETQRMAQMQAIAQCVETSVGPARQKCIQQVRVAASPAEPAPAAQGVPDAKTSHALAGTSGYAGGGAPAHPQQGFMAASFAVR
jgi:hypothetical protein